MTRVKICGLMNLADVELCAEAGADALGFVVNFPQSVPWNLSVAEGRKLMEYVPPFVSTCVVTGGSVEDVLRTAEATRPNIIQLHYQEALIEVKEIAYQLSLMGIKTIKALRINPNGKCEFEIPDPVQATKALVKTGISALIVDAYTASRPGGTGIAVDLSTFKKVQEVSPLPVILAGGLNPETIYGIVHEAQPYAVDVLTGVEKEYGKKDEEKVKLFVKRAVSY